MIKTAFPNFDNLMIASWNVISVYSNVGSEFPELHKAIVDLKLVLNEFEASCVPKGVSTGGMEKLKMRKDFATAQENRVTLLPKPEVALESIEAANFMPPSHLSQTYIDVHTQRSDNSKGAACEQMPPPRIPQLSQHPHREKTHSSDDDMDEKEEEHCIDSRITAKFDHKRGTLHVQGSPRKSSSMSGSAHSSPRSQPSQLPHERVKKPRSHEHEDHEIKITPELSRKRQEYHSSISKTNRSSAGAAKARHSSAEECNNDDKLHDGDGNERPTPFLGNSVLGAKKLNGTAPMAPMLHTKKSSNDMTGNVNGGGRQGY